MAIKVYQIQWQLRYTTIIMNTLLSDSFWIPLLTPKVIPSGNLTCHGFFSWLGFDDLPIDSHSHGVFFSSSQTVTDYRWVNHPFPSSSGKCWIITDRWLVMIYPIWVWVNTYRLPFLVGWTSIYQLFWGSLGTRVLTHPHIFSTRIQKYPYVTILVAACGVQCCCWGGLGRCWRWRCCLSGLVGWSKRYMACAYIIY